MPEAVGECGVQHQASLCRSDLSVSEVFQSPDYEDLERAGATRLERCLGNCRGLASDDRDEPVETSILTKIQDMESVIG